MWEIRNQGIMCGISPASGSMYSSHCDICYPFLLLYVDLFPQTMKVWVKVGNSDPTKIGVEESADVDDLKKAIKIELNPAFDTTSVPNILIKHPETNEVLDSRTSLVQLLNCEIGGSTSPFLVDVPQSGNYSNDTFSQSFFQFLTRAPTES